MSEVAAGEEMGLPPLLQPDLADLHHLGTDLTWPKFCWLLFLTVVLQALLMVVAVVWDRVANLRPKRALQNTEGTFIENKIVLRIMDSIQFILSFLSCIFFVAKAYHLSLGVALYSLELSMAVVFIVMYMVRFWSAHHKLRFCCTMESITDVASISSSIVLPFVGTWLSFTFFRSVHVYKALSSVIQNLDAEDVLIKIVDIAFLTVCLVYCFASVIFIVELLGDPSSFFDGPIGFWDVEETDPHMTFFQAIYFIMVTISTVGYGDFSPKSILGRVVIMFFIVGGVAFFSLQAGNLINILMEAQNGKGSFHGKGAMHVVVTGELTPVMVRNFLQEFYHTDHGDMMVKTCFLTKRDIKDEIAVLFLERPWLKSRVVYLNGTSLSDLDLERAKASQATAVFLLANTRSRSREVHDAGIIMRTLSLSQHMRKNRIPVRQRVQPLLGVLQAENKEHVLASGVPHHRVLCVEELKMALFARSLVTPGVITFVANLICSRSNVFQNSPLEWQREYGHGMAQEAYKTDFPLHVGKKFAAVCVAAYQSHGVTLVGLECPGVHGSTLLVPPPLDYEITSETLGLVIASDADVVFAFSGGSALSSQLVSDRMVPTVATAKPNQVVPAASPSPKPVANTLSTPIASIPENRDPFSRQADDMSQADDQPQATDMSDFLPSENDLVGHILVCGVPDGLKEFVLSIGAKFGDEPRPALVFLDEEEPPAYLWDDVAHVPDTYFFPGNPRSMHDLKQAGVMRASRVVVFSLPFQENQEEYYMEDSYSLFTMLWLQRHLVAANPAARCIVEIQYNDNMPYLDLSDEAEMMSSDERLPVVEQSAEDAVYGNPLYASGSVYTSSLLDSFLVQAYFNPSIIAFVSSIILSQVNVLGYCTVVESVAVPETLYNRPYEAVLAHFVSQGQLAVGLYRAKGTLHSHYPYVYTNPARDCVCNAGDMVFVLSSSLAEPELPHSPCGSRGMGPVASVRKKGSKKQSSNSRSPPPPVEAASNSKGILMVPMLPVHTSQPSI